ncbi:MAG TPA: outer membrane protein assembly factor BamB [Steroidobacteraceae bacterium]|nr:outer membrane protein assembly factor BamB [Steroidobacteraceae bacterium]
MKKISLLLLATMLALGACKSKDDKKKIDEPAKLLDIKSPTVRIQKVWGASVGGGGKKLRLGLGLAAADGKLFAAGRDGDVAAFDLKSGRQLWRTKTKQDLTGGTGASAELVAVGSADGSVLAFSAANGAPLWTADIKGEVLSAPAISEKEVVVRTVDGKLRGLAVADGHELWSTEQQIPKLTLRGVATPVITREMALSGFDNGRVLAVSLADGSTVWDAPVSPSHGRTELERLNDIDAAVKVVGDDVFVVGFQGRAAMLALDSGQIWWTRDLSSYRGLDVDDEQMYVATSPGDVVALNRRTGAEVWRNDSLKNRSLSAPAVVGDYVVVADIDGYVHWFDRATGTIAGRAKAGGDRVTNPPLVVNDTLYVINDDGDVTALRGQPIAARAAKAAPAPEPAPATAPATPDAPAPSGG